MGDLESSLAAPAVGRLPGWAPGVETSLGRLRLRMHRHVQATEGPEGFHREMISAAPRLSHAVDLAVREHGLVTDLLGELADALSRVEGDDDIGELRAKGTRVLALLARHRQRGADMVFEAYQCDLGGCD
jgi:hypothetical protein